jgi:hypothetical protein
MQATAAEEGHLCCLERGGIVLKLRHGLRLPEGIAQFGLVCALITQR